MNTRGLLAATMAAAIMVGSIAVGGRVTSAQDATPEAVEAMPARPAHIHSGNCNNLGDVVQPLTDLTAATGDELGQARRAIPVESSYSTVPMTLDAIVGTDHAINVHLSADEIGTYIACGAIGGALDASGALAIGLNEQSNSGYTGVAYLSPGADGASTGVSVFIAQTQGGRERQQEAEATPMVGEVSEAETPEATLPETSEEADVATPEAAEIMETPAGEEAVGTPAMTGEDEQAAAGEQVDVSLIEFAIDMPATVPAGEVTFSVTNDGTITHSFEVEGNGLEEELASPLSPGQSGTLTVDLAPGTYEIYCPIGNHADLGMRVELTVM